MWPDCWGILSDGIYSCIFSCNWSICIGYLCHGRCSIKLLSRVFTCSCTAQRYLSMVVSIMFSDSCCHGILDKDWPLACGQCKKLLLSWFPLVKDEANLVLISWFQFSCFLTKNDLITFYRCLSSLGICQVKSNNDTCVCDRSKLQVAVSYRVLLVGGGQDSLSAP